MERYREDWQGPCARITHPTPNAAFTKRMACNRACCRKHTCNRHIRTDLCSPHDVLTMEGTDLYIRTVHAAGSENASACKSQVGRAAPAALHVHSKTRPGCPSRHLRRAGLGPHWPAFTQSPERRCACDGVTGPQILFFRQRSAVSGVILVMLGAYQQVRADRTSKSRWAGRKCRGRGWPVDSADSTRLSPNGRDRTIAEPTFRASQPSRTCVARGGDVEQERVFDHQVPHGTVGHSNHALGSYYRTTSGAQQTFTICGFCFTTPAFCRRPGRRPIGTHPPASCCGPRQQSGGYECHVLRSESLERVPTCRRCLRPSRRLRTTRGAPSVARQAPFRHGSERLAEEAVARVPPDIWLCWASSACGRQAYHTVRARRRDKGILGPSMDDRRRRRARSPPPF